MEGSLRRLWRWAQERSSQDASNALGSCGTARALRWYKASVQCVPASQLEHSRYCHSHQEPPAQHAITHLNPSSDLAFRSRLLISLSLSPAPDPHPLFLPTSLFTYNTTTVLTTGKRSKCGSPSFPVEIR